MKLLAVFILLGVGVLADTVTDLPLCAQTCLTNSTSTQKSCQVTDLACLCTNFQFIGALSCCLATQCNNTEQQAAIKFNQAECSSVNETAPPFVGCSPFGLFSSVFLGSAATTARPLTTSSAISMSMSITMTTRSNPLVTTISGITESGLESFTQRNLITATYGKQPLLIGSCTVPHFAQVTDVTGLVTEYAEVGCSPERPDCCPFPFGENAVLTQCPQDYSTTFSACCPSGFQVYFTTVGLEVPCYTMPAITYMPASSPTVSGLTIITEHVFSKMYLLDPNAGHSTGLGTGAKAGIAVATIAAMALAAAIMFILIRRRKQNKLNRQSTRTFPRSVEMEEPVLSPRPQELASPENPPASPRSPATDWPMGTGGSPPAYEDARSRPQSMKGMPPQELPGSTFISEHHPAYQSPLSEQDSLHPPSPPRSPPRTPTRSPIQMSPKSPQTSPRVSGTVAEGSPVISPMGSPNVI